MGVGHYGVFNGSRYRKEIAPAIAEFILTQEMVAAVDRRSQPRLRKVVG
jgi:poly(3-hydroxybutyrate) depolymerase